MSDLGELRKMLEEVLATMTPREEKLFRLRFGLDDGRVRTLEEAAEELGVTRERARQIENKLRLRLTRGSYRCRGRLRGSGGSDG